MAINNNNSARTITNTADGGDLTATDVQTIEFTSVESGNAITETTIRKENGDVRATIINK